MTSPLPAALALSMSMWMWMWMSVCMFVWMTGCSGGGPGASPEAAVRQLIASARAGDAAAVYRRLGPRTRGRIEAILASARKSGGARLLRPEDLVTVGWVPPAWEASNVHEQNRSGEEADVEAVSANGDRQTVHVVREAHRWVVELPLR